MGLFRNIFGEPGSWHEDREADCDDCDTDYEEVHVVRRRRRCCRDDEVMYLDGESADADECEDCEDADDDYDDGEEVEGEKGNG